jgi:metal-responsive CopG/Arc/MetJ family transcriptional regulator
MKLTRMMIQLPRTLKAKLDVLRKQGTTSSGLIRNLVEREFHRAPRTGRTGREARKGRQ